MPETPTLAFLSELSAVTMQLCVVFPALFHTYELRTRRAATRRLTEWFKKNLAIGRDANRLFHYRLIARGEELPRR
jgi:hypothetical protein